MKIVNLVQGTPEWHAHRLAHFNASDAPAMMGCSPYKSRAQLLRELHSGVAGDVDAGTQRLYDAGHRFEALCRPLGEQIVKDELYPCVGTNGKYSASFDGLTLGGELAWEHKSLNEALRTAMPAGPMIGDTSMGDRLPLQYRIQMEHQCMVSGAARVLFSASSWNNADECNEVRHCWYEPDAGLRALIIAGWEQFAKDLAAYTAPAAAEPAPVGRAPETLPALRIEVTGAVTASNLAEFKATALAAIRSVNRTLKTDSDFANADKAIKWASEVEAKLKAAKEHALSQTADIDALFKTLDDISKEAREVRLDLSKVVDRRKLEVKEEAIGAARKALDAHIADLQGELAPMRLQPVAADFAGAIKGLRSIASMQDALDTALAGAKIAADAQARVIRGNVAHFKAHAQGFEFLFADLGQVVHKAAEDFAYLVEGRLIKHRVEEQAREAKRQADEAARIAAAEQRAREQEAARLAAEAKAQAEPARPALQPVAEPVQAQPVAVAANAATAADEPATLNLGAINALLDADGGMVLRGEFVTNVLQVPAAGRSPRGIALWQASQFPLIVAALNSHLRFVQAQRKAA